MTFSWREILVQGALRNNPHIFMEMRSYKGELGKNFLGQKN